KNVPLGYTPGGHRRPINFKKSLRRTSSKPRKKGGVQKILPSKKNLLRYLIYHLHAHIVKSSRKIFLTSDNVLFKQRKCPGALWSTRRGRRCPLTSAKVFAKNSSKLHKRDTKQEASRPEKNLLQYTIIAVDTYIVKSNRKVFLILFG